MGEEVLALVILKFRKKNHCHERPIFSEDVDIEKVLVSNKIFSGEKNYKYFIGYSCTYNASKNKRLCKKL